MSTNKITSDDYNVYVGPYTGNIWSGTMSIYGNLSVTGNVTYINTEELTVEDPFITVAGNNNGSIATATYQQQGLVAQTSASTFAGLRFNNGTLSWEISPSVDANGAPITSYSAITTGTASAAGANTQIQFNNNTAFAANANFTFDYTTSKLTLQGHQNFGNIGTAPTSVANTVSVYHNAVGTGGTGLYVKTTAIQDELVSKSKAIVFAIIF